MDPSVGQEGHLALFMNRLLSGEHQTILGLLFLGVARLFPIVAQAPFLGARVLPHPVKVVLSISLWMIFLPTFAATVTSKLAFSPLLLILAAKEYLIGLLMGFFVSIPFTLMQSVGFIIDHQRGAASLMVNDPSIQNQASPIGLFYNFILIYLFYLIDGPFYFFEVVNNSFEFIPVDRFFSPAFFTDQQVFWQEVMALMNLFMALSIQLAAPAMIIILMTDFFLGIANRLAPQVQIIFLGLGLKSMVPIIVMMLGWYLFIEQASKEAMDWLYKTADMVTIMGKSQAGTTPAPP